MSIMRDWEESVRITQRELDKLGKVEEGDSRWVILTPDGRVAHVVSGMEEAHSKIAYTNWLSLPILSAIEKKLSWREGAVE